MSNYDEQSERIQSVFNRSEIPEVSEKHLEHYLKWLKGKLTLPCLLTGIESLGYFGFCCQSIRPEAVHYSFVRVTSDR